MAIALVGVACGKSSNQGSAPTTPATIPATTPATTPVTTPPATSGGGTASLTLTQVDFQFTPAQFTVKSGATISVHDASPRTPHTFTIPGKGINVVNQAGQIQTVAINLPPGTYQFICTFHFASHGMKGTLTVT